jgi:hypothetical protein
LGAGRFDTNLGCRSIEVTRVRAIIFDALRDQF